MGYARLLANHPYIIVIVVLLAVTIQITIVSVIGKMPDFSDPKAGFETRNTRISESYLSWRHVLTATGSRLHTAPPITGKVAPSIKKSLVYFEKRPEVNPPAVNQSSPECSDIIGSHYSRVVYRSLGDESLFTADNIKAMCRLEDSLIRERPSFKALCEEHPSSQQCCPSKSLGNYIALLQGKMSCDMLTPDDVIVVKNTLRECVSYYSTYKLRPDCWSHDSISASCSDIPRQCVTHNVIYNLLHYVLDIHVMNNDSSSFYLRYVMSFLPVAASTSSLELYQDITGTSWKSNNIELYAANFGIKFALFDEYLRKDTIWIILAGITVTLLIWLYTTSFFLMLMTVMSLFMTLTMTYFVYTYIYRIEFFPFMNLLTVIVILGIGSDDMFIYSHTWAVAKAERNNGTLRRLVSNTLHQAAGSMLVTSLTTAAAFFSSAISDITTVKCFAVFSGTAVLVNFLLNVTFIPACLLTCERWFSNYCQCCHPENTNRKAAVFVVCKAISTSYQVITESLCTTFSKHLPRLIARGRYLWAITLTGLGIGGAVLVFVHPKLKLPSTDYFQVFSSDNPLEIYDQQIRHHFGFEVTKDGYKPTMPLTFIWGVEPSSGAGVLDPSDRGELKLDTSFSISDPASQKWLLDFCSKVRQTPFYQPSWGGHLSDCFIENFKTNMEQPCINGLDLHPCCEQTHFPYKEDIFNECIQRYMRDVVTDPFYVRGYSSAIPGLRFSEDGHIVALIVEFDSNVSFSYNYLTMNAFYNTVNDWFSRQLQSSPGSLANGWFSSHQYLTFYDLQRSIVHGTTKALGITIAIVCGTLFLCTLNVLLTMYAVLTIVLAVLVLLGILVLVGWELNILESLTISIAVGLAVDFTVHYTVVYAKESCLDRPQRIIQSLVIMGSPVTMAAVTSFITGALLMPSTILAYRNLAVFLMVIMAVSWIYGTFLLLSLLHIIGPQNTFLQFYWPHLPCCRSISNIKHVDKTKYCLPSESTVSSSSISSPRAVSNSSDTHDVFHELVPLKNGKCQDMGPSGDALHHTNDNHGNSEPVSESQCTVIVTNNTTVNTTFHDTHDGIVGRNHREIIDTREAVV